MKKLNKVLSLVLVVALVLGLALPAAAQDDMFRMTVTKVDDVVNGSPADSVVENENTVTYSDTDVVRVSIVLESASTIEAGYSTTGIAANTSAMNYRESLQSEQAALTETISKTVLGGKKLDVVWNMTLAANMISANVAYGKIEQIKALDGVKNVVIENRYEPAVTSVGGDDPNMSTSVEMIGSTAAYLDGYTGAGSRIAIIDTGIDDDHQSMDGEAFEYALAQNAAEKNMSVEDYVASLNLMTVSEITAKMDQLNIASLGVAASDLRLSSKIPFAFNYVDRNLTINHDNDTQTEHGSHVAGIATANRFIKEGDSFVPAMDSVLTQGVAPDAQLIVMKVFGVNGGAYDSDYMVAIEDAIIMGCDVVNLSLGSGNAGAATSDEYQDVMDALTESDTVVSMSAGNAYSWVNDAAGYTGYKYGVGYLYAEDVSLDTVGSPGSFTNAFTVASVDNIGTTGSPLTVNGVNYFYSETSYSNAPIATLAGQEQEYVIFQNTGAAEDGSSLLADYADIINGKVVMCFRGTSSFYQKHMAAAEAGAIGCIIINNQPGVINMNLEGSNATIPCVSITQADGMAIIADSTEMTAEDGTVYYTGKISVSEKMISEVTTDEYVMSDFSSWGVPGTLELKPEITAPGGSIYSINGAVPGGKAYEVMSGTSMAAPQVAGMVGLVAQYIRETGLAEKIGVSPRVLAQSLLMSTAMPLIESDSGCWYSLLKQGAGSANVGNAINADSYIMVDGQDDGKVKVELFDDPDRTGEYSATFTINNITDEALSYNLSSSFFTQDIFMLDDILLSDTWTALMGTEVNWTVDGKAVEAADYLPLYDMNGDGFVNSADAQLLLDVVTGKTAEDELASENADVNGDEKVTVDDVYALLKMVDAATVVVPANGSVKVTATIALSAEQKDFFDNYYTSGAYVEGFLFVDAVATEEGVQGVSHSIPVLGFYGNWSDASMFDVGSYGEALYGEQNWPYVPNANGQPNFYHDYMAFRFAGISGDSYGEYYDATHTALNNENGSMISRYVTTLIRNAQNAKYTLTNADTGEVIMENELGAMDAAFYYVNKSAWYYTSRNVNLSWNGTDANGEKLPEGTTVDFTLTAAPELYVKDGKTDWDALGSGASKTVSVTIDNTAPVIEDVYYGLSTGDLLLQASDNYAVDLIAIYGSDGKTVLETLDVSRVEMGSGDLQTGSINAAELAAYGYTQLYITVYDYALNAATYKIDLSEPLADPNTPVETVEIDPTELSLMAGSTKALNVSVTPWISNDTFTWTSSDETVATVDSNGIVTGVGKGECEITVVPNSNPDISATCIVNVFTLELTLNGVLQDENGNPQTFTWDLENDKTWKKGVDIDPSIASATYGNDGSIYVMDAVSGSYAMHKVDPTTGETLADYDGTGVIAYWDMANTDVFNGDYISGVYGPYFFPMQDPAAVSTVGYNVSNALAKYTGASWLIGVASAGYYYDDEDAAHAELYYALDDLGNVWLFEYTQNGVFYLFNFYGTDLGELELPGYGDCLYTSLVAGPDDNLYFSAFDGSTNNIYMLTGVADDEGYLDHFEATMLGDVGTDVWPAALISVDQNSDSQQNAIVLAPNAEVKTAIAKDEVKTVSGSLNAVSTEVVKGELPAEDDTVTVTITADEATHAGLHEVSYDASALELVSCESNAQLSSFNATEGKVVFGYASLAELPAGTALATLTFKVVTDAKSTVITVDGEEETITLRIEVPFDDVHEGDYFFDAVDWAVNEGITNGTSATTFSPEKACTRAQVVTFLWRAAGCPEPTATENPFADVTEGVYYKAILWAVEQGITNGTSATTFSPDKTCTRAQIVTFLYRFAGEPEVKTGTSFTDVAADAYYADAVAWAVANGITNGVSATRFAPENTCTRGQVVTFLYRYAG